MLVLHTQKKKRSQTQYNPLNFIYSTQLKHMEKACPAQGETLTHRDQNETNKGIGWSTGHARSSCHGCVIWALLHNCSTVCATWLRLQEAFGFAPPHLLGLNPYSCQSMSSLEAATLGPHCGQVPKRDLVGWVSLHFSWLVHSKLNFCCSLLTCSSLIQFLLIYPVSYQNLPQAEQQH